MVFTMEGVDPGLAQRGLLEVRLELRRGAEAGTLSASCERLSLVPGTGRHGRIALKLNLPPRGARSSSSARGSESIDRAKLELCAPQAAHVTAWEREGRALVHQLQRFLVENASAFRKARLASVAPQIGIRSGRRICGRTTLADTDVMSARKTPLGIARGCWPMERWGQGLRPEMAFFDERAYYEIPLDCLRPAELDNVFAAGRCLAATAGALSSARVIGTSMMTGWAAGTLAASQMLGRPIPEAVETIRKQLEGSPSESLRL